MKLRIVVNEQGNPVLIVKAHHAQEGLEIGKIWGKYGKSVKVKKGTSSLRFEILPVDPKRLDIPGGYPPQAQEPQQ